MFLMPVESTQPAERDMASTTVAFPYPTPAGLTLPARYTTLLRAHSSPFTSDRPVPELRLTPPIPHRICSWWEWSAEPETHKAQRRSAGSW